jgi:hypothetical protein
MKRPSLNFWIVATGAALAVAFAWREWADYRTLSARSDRSNAQTQITERERTLAEAALLEARTRADALSRALANAKARSEAAQIAASDRTQEDPRSPAAISALRTQYLKAYRDALPGQWGLFFALLGLSADQVEALKGLLAQREENNLLVEQTARAKGVDVSSPEIQALDDDLDRQNKAAIAALLGPQGYAQFRDYLHDRAILPVVSDLAAALYSSDSPLSAPQAQQLIGVLADESAKKNGATVVAGTLDWNAAIARSQSILSPTQLSALSSLLEQYQATSQLNALAKNLTATAAAQPRP